MRRRFFVYLFVAFDGYENIVLTAILTNQENTKKKWTEQNELWLVSNIKFVPFKIDFDCDSIISVCCVLMIFFLR